MEAPKWQNPEANLELPDTKAHVLNHHATVPLSQNRVSCDGLRSHSRPASDLVKTQPSELGICEYLAALIALVVIKRALPGTTITCEPQETTHVYLTSLPQSLITSLPRQVLHRSFDENSYGWEGYILPT